MFASRCRSTTTPIIDFSEDVVEIGKETNFNNDIKNILEKEFNKLNTNKVVLFNERLKHIKERHPEVVENIKNNLESIIKSPNYILKDSKNENTVWFIKELGNNKINSVVKLSIADIKEHKDYLNSIITSHYISDKQLKRYLKKNKIILDCSIKKR